MVTASTAVSDLQLWHEKKLHFKSHHFLYYAWEGERNIIWLDFFFLGGGSTFTYILIFFVIYRRNKITGTHAAHNCDCMSSYFLQELTCQLTCQATSCKNASVWSVAQAATHSLVLLKYVCHYQCRVDRVSQVRIIRVLLIRRILFLAGVRLPLLKVSEL